MKQFSTLYIKEESLCDKIIKYILETYSNDNIFEKKDGTNPPGNTKITAVISIYSQLKAFEEIAKSNEDIKKGYDSLITLAVNFLGGKDNIKTNSKNEIEVREPKQTGKKSQKKYTTITAAWENFKKKIDNLNDSLKNDANKGLNNISDETKEKLSQITKEWKTAIDAAKNKLPQDAIETYLQQYTLYERLILKQTSQETKYDDDKLISIFTKRKDKALTDIKQDIENYETAKKLEEGKPSIISDEILSNDVLKVVIESVFGKDKYNEGLVNSLKDKLNQKFEGIEGLNKDDLNNNRQLGFIIAVLGMKQFKKNNTDILKSAIKQWTNKHKDTQDKN